MNIRLSEPKRTRSPIDRDLLRKYTTRLSRLREVEQEILARTATIPENLLPASERTLKSLAEEYVRLNPHSVGRDALSTRKKWLDRFQAWLGSRPFNAQTTEEFLAAVRDARQYASSYRTSILSCIRCFLEWADKTGRLSFRVWTKGYTPKAVPRKPRRSFTEAEYQAIKDAAGASPLGWVITLAWYTGMAWSDCLDLRWGEVDLSTCVIQRRRCKTGTLATIPFEVNGELHLELLKLHEKASRTGLTEPHHQVSPDATTLPPTMFRRLKLMVGLDDERGFHNFRSTMVSRLVNSGVNPIVGMNIVGHKSHEIFKHYANVDVSVLREAVTKAQQTK